MADRTENHFPLMSLPIELRENIWRLSIFLRVMSTGDPSPERGSEVFKAPVVAHVCQESRRVAMRTGRLYQKRSTTGHNTEWTWFDTEHDTLFVNGSQNLQTWLSKFELDFPLAIQHVFVGIAQGPRMDVHPRQQRRHFAVMHPNGGHQGGHEKPYDSTVPHLFPNLKSMYFYLVEKEDDVTRRISNSDRVPPPRCLQNHNPHSQDVSQCRCPIHENVHERFKFQDKGEIAAMSHFDGPFELDPSKPHEVRLIERIISRRGGGIEGYHERLVAYIDYMVKWKQTIHRRVRGDWILLEWGRTPVAMSQDDLVLLTSPVSLVGGTSSSSSSSEGQGENEDENAVLVVEGHPGHYLANTEHRWVKACLDRMPGTRFVFTL